MKLLKKKNQPSKNGYNNGHGTFPSKETLMLMPRELTEEFRAFVFEKNDKVTKIAAVDSKNPALRRFVRERFGDAVEWFEATGDDISYVLKRYTRDFKDEISRLLPAITKANTSGDIVKLVDLIIGYALNEEASDLHIEPTKNESIVRFRVDGVLYKVLTLLPDIHLPVIARFKILANLRIDDHRCPQDGRIELEKFPDMSLRISTMPTLYGEKVALRILHESHKDLSMEKLGFSEEHQRIIAKNIEKPFGMIVASGPTGSGKTTTLYGLLDSLSKERINISTLEDPVEFALQYVNQVQINPRAKLTFASGLRSLLRQDPDVIMVGEIRDSETAIMAVEAALTGHLVFTTVHTNDAPSAITRFLEMKVEEFALASVINIVIAQRLVRKVCEVCAKKKKLDKAVLKKIFEREDIMQALKGMKKGGIKEIAEQSFLIGSGCDACMNTGYRGRAGIFEVLEVNKKIHDLTLEHASSERIKEEAKKAGFRDMIIDGIDKVFANITTFEEVLRSTRNA